MTMTGARIAEKRRRRITIVWISASAIVIIALLYWEQAALLYVLATVSVTVLLIVVAMADLHGKRETEAERIGSANDSAAIGTSGVAPAPVNARLPKPGRSQGRGR